MNLFENLLAKAFGLTKKINGDLESDITLLQNYEVVDNELIDYIFVEESIGREVNIHYSKVERELAKIRTYFNNKYNFDLDTSDHEQIENYIKILERELKLDNLTNE